MQADRPSRTYGNVAGARAIRRPVAKHKRARPFGWGDMSGSTHLDASTLNATSVEFLLFGGTYGYSALVVCTATLTYYGSLAPGIRRMSPTAPTPLCLRPPRRLGVPFSSPISVTVDNLNTEVIIPEPGSALEGTAVLDATASGDSAVTSVEFEYTLGPAVDIVIDEPPRRRFTAG